MGYRSGYFKKDGTYVQGHFLKSRKNKKNSKNKKSWFHRLIGLFKV